jgi:predicted nucleic acid-binding protein
VPIVYFDASALVKLVIEEDGSDLAASLWDGCDAATSSPLSYPEVCAALAAAMRNHDLTSDAHGRAQADFDIFWAAVRPVELTEQVETAAGRLAADEAINGAGAVHLASALTVTDPLLVVAVWDRRLSVAAARNGLAVSPPTR